MSARILILDGPTGTVIDRCEGPGLTGECPRGEVGHAVPCAGMFLMAADDHLRRAPFGVGSRATVCPVVVARALAGDAGGVREEERVLAGVA